MSGNEASWNAKDSLRQGGPCFYFDTELFAPTTDSFALGWFAAPKRGERVCDLGSGTGLLGTLLLAREPSLTLFCVEQNAAANALAEKGLCRKRLGGRVTLRTGDLRENAVLPAAGSMVLLSNPPYFPAGERRASAAGECGKPRGEEGRLHARRRLCRGGAECCAGADASRSSTGPSGYPTFSARSARTGWSRSGCAS